MSTAPLLTAVQDRAYVVLANALNQQPPLRAMLDDLPLARLGSALADLEAAFDIGIDPDEVLNRGMDVLDLLAVVQGRHAAPRDRAVPPRAPGYAFHLYDFAAYRAARDEALAAAQDGQPAGAAL